MSEHKIDKELVRKRFARSAKTYGEYAVVQKRMARNLIKKLTTVITKKTYPRILDIGCGDGTLTALLLDQFQPKELIANDIVKDFKPLIKEIAKKHQATNTKFITGDIEIIPLPGDIDLIASNAVFQWINHLEEFYANLANNINNRDRACPASTTIAFTTFGINTLPEIRQITGQSLNYLPFNEHRLLLEKYFKVISAHEETDVRHFETPTEVLKHLKQMGVNAIKTQRWKRTDLENFSNEYKKRFSHNNKVTLTYNPLYFILKKKQ